ncbi:hypothetical protein F0562_005696 [Nyssa sinensis]|uniref:Glutamine amidotransferase domain-containing protein n=1 Tax=Nyssa sinensis TaxID=561372 RepID=A0A5J5AL94_9ASTE|nr:hypothetical protein F0562_005696 [Nyssa sinensis]
MGIYDVDTREIIRRLRQDGSLMGVLRTEESKTDEELLETSRSWDIVGVDLINGVSYKAPYEWVDKTDSEWDFNSNGRDGKTFHWHASETLKMKPDGVLFSNGPGDPSAVPFAVETIKEIIGKNQNYAVDPASLPKGVEVTRVNLNDGNSAGLAFPQLKLMSLQYHPEASPRPRDSDSGSDQIGVGVCPFGSSATGKPLKSLIYGRTDWIGTLLGKLCDSQGINYTYSAGRLQNCASLDTDLALEKLTHVFNATMADTLDEWEKEGKPFKRAQIISSVEMLRKAKKYQHAIQTNPFTKNKISDLRNLEHLLLKL